MAFVTPLTTSFKGAVTAPSITPLRLPHATVRSSSAVRMAFSSIDEPERSVSLFDDSIESKDAILTAAYKHVFGNAYLMESEREEFAEIESKFRLCQCNVRDLVRTMAKSAAYRKRFFERTGPYGFIERNFKHLLGRGPVSQQEVSFHVQKLINEGYDAEIDSYIDTEEYIEKFGMDSVPRFIYQGTYATDDSFNRMNMLRQHWDGCSTSTVSGSTAPGKPIKATLIMAYGYHCGNPAAIKRGILAGHDPQPDPPKALPLPLNWRAPVRIRVKVADNHYRVFETPAYKDPVVPDWKKERMGPKRWNGVWF